MTQNTSCSFLYCIIIGFPASWRYSETPSLCRFYCTVLAVVVAGRRRRSRLRRCRRLLLRNCRCRCRCRRRLCRLTTTKSSTCLYQRVRVRVCKRCSGCLRAPCVNSLLSFCAASLAQHQPFFRQRQPTATVSPPHQSTVPVSPLSPISGRIAGFFRQLPPPSVTMSNNSAARTTTECSPCFRQTFLLVSFITSSRKKYLLCRAANIW